LLRRIRHSATVKEEKNEQIMSGPLKRKATRPWLGVAAVALGAFVVITTEFLPIGLLGLIASDLRVSAGVAGLLVAVPGAVAAVAAPLFTVLAGKVDRKLLLLVFLACVGLSNAGVAFASGLVTVLLSRILFGIGVGGFWTFAITIGRRLVPEASGSRATAFILAGVSIGAVAGVPIGTTLGSLAGWRFAFGSICVLTALVAAGLWLTLPSLPNQESVSTKRLLKLPVLRIGLIASALTAAGHFAAYTYLQPLLIRSAHLTYSNLSWTLAAYGVAGALGTFAAERAAAYDLRRTFVAVSVSLGISILLVEAFRAHPVAEVAVVVLWGAAFGALPVCTQIWTYQAAPAQFEAASALGMTVFQSAAAGSFGGGLLVDHAGIPSAFLFGGCLSLACALLLMRSAPLAFMDAGAPVGEAQG